MTYAEKVLDEIEKGNYEEARKHFGWSLRKDSDDMIYSLAEELYSLGFSNMAKRAYQTLLERYPDEDSLKTALADIAISEGEDDEALEYLSSITPDSEAYLQALLVSADLYQTQGMFEVSEQKLLQALDLAPDEEIIRFALAELYYNIKQYKQAIPIYLDLIKQGNFSISQVNLVQRLGMSYALSGQFEKALAYLEQIHSEERDDDTQFQLGITQYELGHIEDAISSFEKLRDTSPDYATTYSYLAVAYEKEGQFQKALTTLQEGIAVDEYNIKLYQKASELAAKLGQRDEAERYLLIALDQEPDNLTIVIMLSNLLIEYGKFEQNIELLTDYLDQDEIDPQLYWNLGRSYANLDNYDDAIKYYDAASEQISSLEFLKDAAIFYRNAGDRQKAKMFVDEYLVSQPNDSEMLELQDELLY